MAAFDGKFFAQGLLDLVKAYERIPHWVLLWEALRHGYPVWLLELSIAVYRLRRVIRVDEAVSEVILAVQGIVAGSGAATTEMKLLMIDVIDKAFTVYPSIQPKVFVDDVSAEMADHDPVVVESQLAGFLLSVCSRLTKDGLEISASKSVVTASNQTLGKAICNRLGKLGISFVKRVKSLGVGMGSGTCKNAGIQNSRLKSFGRFQSLRRAGGGQPKSSARAAMQQLYMANLPTA